MHPGPLFTLHVSPEQCPWQGYTHFWRDPLITVPYSTPCPVNAFHKFFSFNTHYSPVKYVILLLYSWGKFQRCDLFKVTCLWVYDKVTVWDQIDLGVKPMVLTSYHSVSRRQKLLGIRGKPQLHYRCCYPNYHQFFFFFLPFAFLFLFMF